MTANDAAALLGGQPSWREFLGKQMRLGVCPKWLDDVPFCSQVCPSYGDRKCAVLGHRPENICEPMVSATVRHAGLNTEEWVLDDFAMEQPTREALECYLRLYPDHACGLIDLSREMARTSAPPRPLDDEDRALIDDAWRRHVKAINKVVNRGNKPIGPLCAVLAAIFADCENWAEPLGVSPEEVHDWAMGRRLPDPDQLEAVCLLVMQDDRSIEHRIREELQRVLDLPVAEVLENPSVGLTLRHYMVRPRREAAMRLLAALSPDTQTRILKDLSAEVLKAWRHE